MKTIIVPTDFSKAASHALELAKWMAKKTNATIHLANFYSIPVADYSYPDISMPGEILEQIRKAAVEGIDKLSVELKAEGFSVDSTIDMGMIADEVVNLASRLQADLIIMGTTGDKDIMNKIVGSNAAHVMQRVTQPILLVPQDCNCDGIRNVIYLDQLEEDDTAVLSKLFALAEELQIDNNIRLLNVNTGFFFKPINEDLMLKLDKTFGLEKIKLETVDGADVKEGIEHYLENHKIDLVVMSTHKKSFLERVFSKSDTKEMAMYGKLPLLVYHKD
ncbi:MAG: universal stress protein [Chitinophagales bacterium]